MPSVIGKNVYWLKKFTELPINLFGSFCWFVVDIFFILGFHEGPWFRMSSISYPEIMDTQKAVKELAGNSI